jgi:hypothetical protein
MKRLNRAAPRLFLLLLAACALLAARPALAGEAVITYLKIFKGSVPESVEIKVTEPGKCTFDIRQLSEEPAPAPFEIGEMVRAKIFSLASELGNFKNLDLDVHRRIANLGDKTFRYEKDGEAHEVTFNYTVNNTATQLLQIFEGLARQQDHIQTLQRRMKYDRLGVNEALLFLETDIDNKALPEPERLLPVLELIGNDNHIMEMARTRARAIAAKIRDGK